MPTPSTSQVSFASQNGPIEATITFLLARVGRRHQHADAEVVAVEHDVGEDRHAHQRGEDERQVEISGMPASCCAPLPGEVREHHHVGDEHQRVGERRSR